MEKNTTVHAAAMEVAKEVLNEAATTAGFFDRSDAERLLWMLVRAFEHGVTAGIATKCFVPRCVGCPIIGCQRPSMN